MHVGAAVLVLLLDGLTPMLLPLSAEQWQSLCHLPVEGCAVEHGHGWCLAPDHVSQDLPH